MYNLPKKLPLLCEPFLKVHSDIIESVIRSFELQRLRNTAAFSRCWLAADVNSQLSWKGFNLRLISDNCLISLSRPLLGRKLQFRVTDLATTVLKSPTLVREQPEELIVLRWRTVLEAAQSSRTPSRFHPLRREAASEHFPLDRVPSPWTDQLWQAVCQNATLLSAPVLMCPPNSMPCQICTCHRLICQIYWCAYMFESSLLLFLFFLFFFLPLFLSWPKAMSVSLLTEMLQKPPLKPLGLKTGTGWGFFVKRRSTKMVWAIDYIWHAVLKMLWRVCRKLEKSSELWKASKTDAPLCWF